jgi:ADP-heptose:LPS heptosyltransferase
LGFSSPEKSTRFLTRSVPFDLGISRHKRYLTLVSLLIDDKVVSSQYLPEFIPNQSISSLIQFKTPHIVIAPFGGANSFSQMPTRKWNKYQQLISELLIKYPTHLIYLVGSDSEKIDLNGLAQLDNHVEVYTKSIHHLAVLLQKAALFIGNDSFPLFMAVSQHCPSIGIFGPTDAQLIVQDYDDVQYIQADVTCSPCYNPLDGDAGIAYNCPFNTRCMEKISVIDILDLASKIIS